MGNVTLPIHIIKGRGTATRVPHRFEGGVRTSCNDGWGTLEERESELSRLRTEAFLEDARSAIGANDSPDIYFDYSINPYRGCEHGCIYCYARPTHSRLKGNCAWHEA